MSKRQRLDAAPRADALIRARAQAIAGRHDGRIILHFDYDCFYAACFEVERPELKSLPLAVQQKQIIVTCNYEARKRGLYKLQLITEARKACPEVIIVLGEDLTRFRNHSKDNYLFLKEGIWSGRAERLGFDEVWLDVTDMIDYNISTLNLAQLESSWFCLSKEDPIKGFSFDASRPVGGTFPAADLLDDRRLSKEPHTLRLILGSHLAFHLRDKVEEEKGFTSTVGISTNKLLSKLAGNLHKPRGQTVLLPPYNVEQRESGEVLSNVQCFLDDHEIGKIPGIGHKGAQQIRELVKGHAVGYKEGLVTLNTTHKVSVREVRLLPGNGPALLESVLAGPGTPKGIGGKVWNLLHGDDDTEVSKARDIPRQISIEDTYLHLHDLKAVRKQLSLLSTSLIKRLRVDLTATDAESSDGPGGSERPDEPQQHISSKWIGNEDRTHPSGEEHTLSIATSATVDATPQLNLSPTHQQRNAQTQGQPLRRWLAHPRTLRLSTRERKPERSFNRISRSCSMPSFVFGLDNSSQIENLATKLADEVLMPLFTKLVPKNSGFDVNLINIAATNMLEMAGEGASAEGRDIAKMFGNQKRALGQGQIPDLDVPPDEVLAGHLISEVIRGIAGDAKVGDPAEQQESTAKLDDTTASLLTKLKEVDSPTESNKAALSHDVEKSELKLETTSPRILYASSGLSPAAAESINASATADEDLPRTGSEDTLFASQSTAPGIDDDENMLADDWESDDESLGKLDLGKPCAICGALMPMFAMEAHLRFHYDPD